MLPDEPNCRCWSSPVLRPPEEFAKDPVMRASFATAGGAGIPDPATYDQWFTSADIGRRKMAVGVRRYNAVANLLGNARPPEWTDFIDADGKLMPVKELLGEVPFDRAIRKDAVNAAIQQRRALIQQAAGQGFISDPVPTVGITPIDLPPSFAAASPRQRLSIGKLRGNTNVQAERIAAKADLADAIDYEGFDPAIANAMNRSVAQHLELAPALRERIHFLGPTSKYQAWAAETVARRQMQFRAQLGATVSQQDQQDLIAKALLQHRIPRKDRNAFALAVIPEGGTPTGAVLLRDDLIGDSRLLRRVLKQERSAGYTAFSGNTPSSLIDHEMAHHIDKLLHLTDADGTIIDAELAGIFRRYSRSELAKSLGDASTRKPVEAIAEAWSQSRNSRKPTAIAKDVADLIEHRLKRL